jgi:hypothetical protein
MSDTTDRMIAEMSAEIVRLREAIEDVIEMDMVGRCWLRDETPAWIAGRLRQGLEGPTDA